jgi:hypothetical protein
MRVAEPPVFWLINYGSRRAAASLDQGISKFPRKTGLFIGPQERGD